MFKKDTDPKLQEFWERKLNINYAVEFEQYKKLCGIPYKKKLASTKYPDRQNLLTYDVWHQSVMDSIKKLTYYEILEYSRFLNQKIRNNEYKFTMSQTILAPFILFFVSLVIGILNNFLSIFLSRIAEDVFTLCSLMLPVFCLSLYVLKKYYVPRKRLIESVFTRI